MSELLPGSLLAGRYELRRRLGAGGMGEVWLATEAGSERALKLLGATIAGDPRALALLQAEFARTRALLHPNIVRVHEFYAGDGLAFIVMQYLPGGDLRQLRARSLAELTPPLLAVCDALDYAHRRGVIHRDIKAANVLLDERGVAYLGDFGVAAVLDAQAPATRGGGSQAWVSPQQRAGAPPSIADDVYGFGALLVELLSGDTPPIEAAAEALPATDASGRPLPESLRRLVSATLDTEPVRRPAGMAAVRAALDEVRAELPGHRDADVIRPVTRRRPPADATAGNDATVLARRAGGLPAPLVFAALGVLMLLAIGVVFLLPRAVPEHPPVLPRPAPPEAAESRPVQQSETQRQAVEDLLGKLLALEDELRTLAVDRWGGADWAEARRLTNSGDVHYRERDYMAAAVDYRQALGHLQKLRPQVGDALAAALAAGDEALLAGDQARAISQFELALVLEPANARALRGLERAGKLPQLLPLLSEAAAHEQAGELDAAEARYAEALALDSDWPGLRESLQRVREQRTQARFARSMARGFEALAAGRLDAARTAFRAALQARPGDAEASAALRQVESERRLQQVVDLERAAHAREEAEDWDGAIENYQQALAIDPNLESSRQGLARAQARAELARRLDAMLAASDTLNDDRNWQQARTLVDEARALDPKGPELARQIAALELALRIAATPVPVRLQSDNLTDVVIYKVGRLGRFSERVLALRPGRYVAVGRREGYRDARRSFLVAADGSTPPIVVRCEEPI